MKALKTKEALAQGIRPHVCCPKCNGDGKIPMPDELWEVLNVLRWHGPKCAEQVALEVDWFGHQTAINNRLEALRDMGLVKREKKGRMWMYAVQSNK